MATSLKPLVGTRILSMAVNLPGPVALARLRSLGAAAIKIEPPVGDPLAEASPRWFEKLHRGVQIYTLDLKDEADRARFKSILEESDLLLTSSRLSALERLGLGWSRLSNRFPDLLQIAIIGSPPPDEGRPGHDLTYQAALGLVDPPRLPRTLLADMAGAEKTVSTALSLILSWKRAKAVGIGRQGRPLEAQDRIAYVSLADAAAEFAQPLKFGLTGSGGILGGSLPGYNIYKAKEGWVAIAALEIHFVQRLVDDHLQGDFTHKNLANFFSQKTAQDWETWAEEKDLPIVKVRETLEEIGSLDP